MIQLNSRLLARNTIINFSSHILPFVVGFLATPFIVCGLGTERFGLISIIWVVLGYFGIFNLGMGRATTKYVAETLGRGEIREAPRIVWTAVVIQIIFGVFGAIVLILLAPYLVEHALKISPQHIDEARKSLYTVAFALPVVMVAGSFSGVLEAEQRFDLVNAVNVPLGILTFLLPVLGLFLGFGLPGIVFLIFVARIGALSALVRINFRLMPALKHFSFSRDLLPRLFAYGGWIAVGNNIMNPVLLGLDRLLIGSLMSMRYVAYYSAPYEVVARLGVVPGSLATTLFPAFSTLEGIKDRRRMGVLFARSVKYVLLVLGPIVVAIGVFAREILQIWLGSEFARESSVVLGILVVSALVNSLGRISDVLLTGCGRPDIPTKCRLVELPIYVVMAWFMVGHWGIAGAAIAWTIRIMLDTILQFVAAARIYQWPAGLFSDNRVIFAGFGMAAFAAVAGAVKISTGMFSMSVQMLSFSCLFVLLVFCIWKYFLDESERNAVLRVIRSTRNVQVVP